MKRKLFIVIILSLLSTEIWAASISGRVYYNSKMYYDLDGPVRRYVPHSQVILKEIREIKESGIIYSPEIIYKTTTDGDGKFNIQVNTGRDYILEAYWNEDVADIPITEVIDQMEVVRRGVLQDRRIATGVSDLVRADQESEYIVDIQTSPHRQIDNFVEPIIPSPADPIKNMVGFKVYGIFNQPLMRTDLRNLRLIRYKEEQAYELSTLTNYLSWNIEQPDQIAILVEEPGSYAISWGKVGKGIILSIFEVETIDGEITLEVNLPVFLRGKVQDKAGNPVEGAQIRVLDKQDYIMDDMISVLVGNNAIYGKTLLLDRKEDRNYRLVVNHRAYIEKTRKLDIRSSKRSYEIDLVLEPKPSMPSLSGNVINRLTKEPITDFNLVLYNVGERVRKTSTTDSDGMYSFLNLWPGSYYLMVDPEYGKYCLTVSTQDLIKYFQVESQESKKVDLDFNYGGVVTGVITDQEGGYVQNSKVKAIPFQDLGEEADKWEHLLTTQTDKHGNYTVGPAAPGNYCLYIHLDPKTIHMKNVVIHQGETVIENIKATGNLILE